MRAPAIVSASVAILLLSGCTPHHVTSAKTIAPTLAGDVQHPAAANGWVDTHLYFGLGPADHPEQGVSESDWRTFLDREVTPRFPSGLSVVDLYGQWRSSNGGGV